MSQISRRGWIKSTALAGAAIGVGASLRADEKKKPPARPGWKTALGLNGFQSSGKKYKKSFPIWEILDFANHSGFDGIELVQNWPQGSYPAAKQKNRVRALRRLYEGFGLKPFSIQTGAAGAFDPNPAVRRAWVNEMRDRIALSKALGGECVGTWPFGPLRGQTVDRAIKNLAASLRETARIAHDEGIILAFEIEPPFVFRTEKHLVQILEQADEPKLKTIYDPSHFDLMNRSSGNPHEMLKRVGVEHIGYVHFTDTDGTLRDGGTSKHLPVGDGHIDVEASFKTLWDGDFRGWMMIDGWEIPDPYDAGRKGIAAIHEFLKRK